MSLSATHPESKTVKPGLKPLVFLIGALVGATAGYFAADFMLKSSTGQAWVSIFWAMLGGCIAVSILTDEQPDPELEEAWTTQWRGMP